MHEVIRLWDRLKRLAPRDTSSGEVQYLARIGGVSPALVYHLRAVRNACAHPVQRGWPSDADTNEALRFGQELWDRLVDGRDDGPDAGAEMPSNRAAKASPESSPDHFGGGAVTEGLSQKPEAGTAHQVPWPQQPNPDPLNDRLYLVRTQWPALRRRMQEAHELGQKDPAAAWRSYAALVPELQRVLGDEDIDTLAARHSCAYYAGRAGHDMAASRLYTVIAPDLARVLGIDHPDVAAARQGMSYYTGRAGWDPVDRPSLKTRRRRGKDAVIKVEVSLHDCAFGVVKELLLETAVVCCACEGFGTAEGTRPGCCGRCLGLGELSETHDPFPGTIGAGEPCPTCQGFGTLLHEPCQVCYGDGRTRSIRTIRVRIPAGTDNGTRIQLAGEGEVGPGGGQAADLYLELVELPHPHLTRAGDDLHLAVRIPEAAAEHGGSIDVDTLDGPQRISIPPGAAAGQVLRLRGFGITHLRTQGRGDLLLHLENS